VPVGSGNVHGNSDCYFTGPGSSTSLQSGCTCLNRNEFGWFVISLFRSLILSFSLSFFISSFRSFFFIPFFSFLSFVLSLFLLAACLLVAWFGFSPTECCR
jgi:hypothetical protein